jgi:hypothetical protein
MPDEAAVNPCHEPIVHRRSDGLWEVVCLGCWLDSSVELPVGIGLPIKSRSDAERILQNHALATVGPAVSTQ